MLKAAAAGSHGGRDDDGESEPLSPQTAPQAGETARAASARARAAKVNTARVDAEVVLKELGVERIAKTEFVKYFKRTSAGKPRLLCAGSYATVLM